MPAICPRCAKKHNTDIASRKPTVSVCTNCRATAPTGNKAASQQNNTARRRP